MAVQFTKRTWHCELLSEIQEKKLVLCWHGMDMLCVLFSAA